jgi:hypothetical protein
VWHLKERVRRTIETRHFGTRLSQQKAGRNCTIRGIGRTTQNGHEDARDCDEFRRGWPYPNPDLTKSTITGNIPEKRIFRRGKPLKIARGDSDRVEDALRESPDQITRSGLMDEETLREMIHEGRCREIGTSMRRCLKQVRIGMKSFSKK